MKKKYELVIFDCDGTLVNSEPLTNSLIAKMLQERNIAITQEECLSMFAGKTLVHITSYIKEQGVSINDDAFEAEYRERCMALFNDELETIPGVVEFLEKLDIPYCIASNGPKKKMEVTLPASGLDKYFETDRIFSAYDIQSWKPEPTLFEYAAQQMNVAIEKCVVIEDTWSGVMAAVSAHMDVLAYNPHLDERIYLDGVPNFTNMSDIEKVIL